MTIELPDEELKALHLTPEQVGFELAMGLYAGREVTLGHAAKIAGCSYSEFMIEAGRRGICIDYREEDALADIQTLRE